MSDTKTAFVTGATGLLGNHVVHALLAQGWQVRALVRSEEKGRRQFGDIAGIERVTGDMKDVAAFADRLAGCDVLFHTAAYFRDNYKGGNHWHELKAINIEGTGHLLEQAHRAGIRRFVHTSSVAVLTGAPGQLLDETCLRRPENADDYYRSKILADDVVLDFLRRYPDMHGCMVLPGWMWGPADLGPTSSGQLARDILHGKLPGLIPGSFSLVDARDVAQALILAAQRGQCGGRYLAAGRHMTMQELVPMLGSIAGVKTPTRVLPMILLYALAVLQEAYSRLSGKPILLSLATVRLMMREADRSHYNPAKSERELGLSFRPLEQTLVDTLSWLRANAP
ncbi:SDR family oxidoreductase [Serratia nevei]|uniref:SDR family oxidoreductase n=1 Tax=Serratia nevei TaxID=2703794 RepID=UPI00209D5FC6|nr:SDR family oxidoreductase [Serratia nevei]MCP1104027.1 SDR family oxidoreductase [Serratia nevei]